MLCFLGLFMILPILYSGMNAFKPLDELYRFPPRFFVQRPTGTNFFLLHKLSSNLWVPFSRYLFNSVFVAMAATVGHVVIASMAAYPLAKFRLPVKWLFDLVVMTLLFNGVALWIPQYVILAQTGMINTFFAYIVPGLAAPIGLFLMKQFMEQVPFTLIESAMIDGAKHTRVFWQIVMPQVKPAWLTLTVFSFQSVWNQQAYGIVFDEQRKLLNNAIESIGSVMSGQFQARLGVAMAGAVILMIPPILVFVLTQDKVIETMAHSGIKG